MRVFVTQRWGGGGVLLVPRASLEALREDGYREATAAEVAGWYRLRGQKAPAAVLDQARERPLRVPVVFGVSGADPSEEVDVLRLLPLSRAA